MKKSSIVSVFAAVLMLTSCTASSAAQATESVTTPESKEPPATEVQNSDEYLYLGNFKLPGAPSRALYQLIKVEYFSDLCLYEIFQNKDLQKEMGIIIDGSFNSYSNKNVGIVTQCLAQQTMPNNCRLLQEHLLRFAQYARAFPRGLGALSGYTVYFRGCIRDDWVNENWQINEHNQNPSPLEWSLWNDDLRTKKNSVSKAKADYMSKASSLIGGHRPAPPTFQERYWFYRCGYSTSPGSKGLRFSPKSEIDLIFCQQRDRNVQGDWRSILDRYGVEYATVE